MGRLFCRLARGHTPGAKAPILAGFERAKAEALAYLDAKAEVDRQKRVLKKVAQGKESVPQGMQRC
jgi:hypothetical protein